MRLTISEEKINFLAPVLLSLLVFVIPISSTLKSIVLVLCLIAVVGTPYYRGYLLTVFNTLWARAAFILFLYIGFASIWSDAPIPARFYVIDKYAKLIFFPILTVAFIRSSTRSWALNSYIMVMLITCVLSLLKNKNMITLNRLDPGEVFYNHIVTSFMVALGCYIAIVLIFNIRGKFWDVVSPINCLWLKLKSPDENVQPKPLYVPISTEALDVEPTTERLQPWKNLYYIAMVLLGTYQLFFINTGRSGYIAYFLFLSVFILQKMPLKKATIGIFIFTTVFFLAYLTSPVMKSGTNRLVTELRMLRHHETNTSLGYRLKFHLYARSLFKQHPFIGVGTGGFQFRYLKDKPIPSLPKLKDPHSQYWLTLAEGGLIGLILYLLFFGILYLTALKLNETKQILIGLLTVFCIMSFSDTIFCYSALGYLLIVFTALCFGELIEKKYVSKEPIKEKYNLTLSWEPAK